MAILQKLNLPITIRLRQSMGHGKHLDSGHLLKCQGQFAILY